MRKKEIIFGFLIGLGLLLYLHNYLVYPPTRGLDSVDHIAYIQYIVDNRSIPAASEGLQMYQPPLYYLLSGLLYGVGNFFGMEDSLKLVQLISLFSAFGNIILIYLLAKKVFSKRYLVVMATLFVMFLPILVYEAAVVSNEMLLSFLVTLSICYFISNRWEKSNTKKAVVLGLFGGLAVLTKYSGLVLVAAVLLVLLASFLKSKKRALVINAGVFLLVVGVIAGWFYLRQFVLFGNPLILANDPKLFPYWQYPGFRDVHFYTNLEGIIPLNVFGAEGESFWGGTYNSLWVDTHNTFLPIIEFSKAGAVIIYLALIPTSILLLGFCFALRKIKKERFRGGYLLLVVYSFFSFVSYTYYTYKLPFGSSIKAFYMLGCVLPWSIFFGLGVKKVIKWLGRFSWVLYCWLIALVLVIYKLYWYQAWWQNIGE